MKRFLILLFLAFGLICQAQQPFVTTWEVTAGDLEILIPQNYNIYSYNYTIDFGDGTTLTNQNGSVFHTYNQPGIYTVSITGAFPAMDFNDEVGNNDVLIYQYYWYKLKSVEQWGDIQWEDMSFMFYKCNNLQINATDIPDLTAVTSLRGMFYDIDSINVDLNTWNFSTITDMGYMFHGVTTFNQSVENWNILNVTKMDCMFCLATSFNQPLNNWDISSVTDISLMFSGASAFNQPLDNWNTSNVQYLWATFADATSFNQPLNGWDTSNVVSMAGMFSNATVFNEPLNNWNTSNVTSMHSMFRNAVSFNQDISNWDVSNVEIMQQMFRGATNFNQSIENWDIGNVTSLRFMFENATTFNQDLSSWDFNDNILIKFITNSAMSSNNYDLLLDRLIQLNLVDGILEADGVEYCNPFSRQYLIDNGWIITDAGLANDCNYNFVSGTILYDMSNNGCDPNDIPFSDFLINVNNGSDDSAYAINQNGEFIIGLDTGNYNLSIIDSDNIFNSNPTSQSISFTGQNEFLQNVDFCMTANSIVEDLSIDVFPLQDAIPGFETDYQIIVNNNGTLNTPNVEITFTYDENFQTYVSSSIPPSSNTTDLITFSLGTLAPFSSTIIDLTLINAIPPILNGGETLTFTTQVTPDANDANPTDNMATYNQVVVNSFDPNDKMVVQGDAIADESIGEYLDYRIRFQNVGTANALNVKIIDTISSNLDWTTFQPINSSHNYRIEIENQEQITYYFDNINLPYEDADAEGSNGYITYKIKPKSSVQIGDTFENTAYIYFDFNLPIVTNTVVTTVVDELSTIAFDLEAINLYPNPVKDILRINLPPTLEIDAMNLFDLNGRLIKSDSSKHQINLEEISSGVYILQIETNKGIFNEKIIKK